MSDLVFRQARIEDLPAIVALLADDDLGRERESLAAGDAKSYAQAFERLGASTENTQIVGELDGRIVATLQLTLIPGLSKAARLRAQIENVRVASDLRSRGIGAQLVDYAEGQARDAGANFIQLMSSASRKQAHAFYERLGYKRSHLGFKKAFP
jgi:ribosomal protein S18 acetylase RimI-like enzyme